MNARRKRLLRCSVACALTATAGAALAVMPSSHPMLQAELALTDGSAVIETKFIDTQVPAPRAAAWDRFRKDLGPAWRGFWDPARRVPSQLFGPGVPVPGSVADDKIALAAARDLVDKHIALLAPGAQPGDLVAVSNTLNPRGDLRHIGFTQTSRGLPVLGGGVTVAFKNDRLFFVTSDAYPDVHAGPPRYPLAAGTAETRARDHITGALGLTGDLATDRNVTVAPRIGPVVLPVARGTALHKPAALSYYTVYAVSVTTEQPAGGGWDVYVEANSGQVIGQRMTTRFADGTVAWKLGARRPGVDLQNVPAQNTETSAGTTDGAGVVDVGTGVDVTLQTDGPLVRMSNSAGDNIMTATVNAEPGATRAATVPQNDIPDLAVYMTFAYANYAKEFVRAELNPGLSWLDQRLSATVNRNQTCNAYYDGGINMFTASSQCENTGVLADVIIHEFGHGLHHNSLLGGVRADGALGEAHGDLLAVTIAGKSNMGVGFFKDNPDQGMRELNPASDKRWPDDRTGEVHDDGEIYGQTGWDLREALIAAHGQAAGVDLFNRLWYATVQRASSTPDTYGIILSEDDDDGDLTNGTPNVCIINKALDPHGLVPDGADVGTSPSIGTPVVDGLMVSVPFTIPPDQGGDCAVSEISSARMLWSLRADPSTSGEVDMDLDTDELRAALPSQDPNTVVNYMIEVTLSDGTVSERPLNPADREYELYVGRTEDIYCADFEAEPAGWTFGADTGSDDWEVGAPTGWQDGPADAWGGSGVLATSLSGNYSNDSSMYAELTVTGTAGYDAVRLHYRRWLAVEDGFFDKATIHVDGEQKWANLDTDQGNSSDTHHKDREWRFHDVDLTEAAADDEVTIRFQLDTDPGLEFAGWHLDDVCVVGFLPGPAPMCGDGTVDDGEECDDGNDTDGDGCSAECIDEDGGGGGGAGDGDEAGGCCDSGGGRAPIGPLALALLVFAAAIRRKTAR